MGRIRILVQEEESDTSIGSLYGKEFVYILENDILERFLSIVPFRWKLYSEAFFIMNLFCPRSLSF